MAQPERISVEIELPADPWDFKREGDGLGEISQEVEVYGVVGVGFDGNPTWKGVFLGEGFEGHPLRRDFLLQRP